MNYMSNTNNKNEIQIFSSENIKMRLFPLEDQMGVGGAVCLAPGFYKPSSTDGPLVYLNGNPDVQHILDKIEKHSRTVAQSIQQAR